jgi:hypothetical protein
MMHVTTPHQYFCKIRKTEIFVQSLSVSQGLGLISEYQKNYLPSFQSLQSLSKNFAFRSSRSSHIQQVFLILTNLLMVCYRGGEASHTGRQVNGICLGATWVGVPCGQTCRHVGCCCCCGPHLCHCIMVAHRHCWSHGRHCCHLVLGKFGFKLIQTQFELKPNSQFWFWFGDSC